MDCFKYKIQLSERTTKKYFFFFKQNLQTTQFKNLRAQASEADYYIVIIHLTGEQVQQSRPLPELGHVELKRQPCWRHEAAQCWAE